MRYIVNSEQMRRADENTSTFFGMDPMILMERASLSMAEAIMKRFTNKDRILIFAGSGGNGGDGVCLGRILSLRGFSVTICLAKELESCAKSLQKQVWIAQKYKVPFVSFNDLKKGDQKYAVIVDGLLGNGVNRTVTGIYEKIITWINEAGSYVYAVDLPSGINADSGAVLGVAVKANETFSFGFEKFGTSLYPGKSYAGKVTIAEIGITKESFLDKLPKSYALENKDLLCLLKRSANGNKGTFGKVAIIAGSFGMAGAAMFSAKATLRMGAGMVKIITHVSNRNIMQSQFPEAMLSLYGKSRENDGILQKTDHDKQKELKKLLLDAFSWADEAVIGPGLSTDQEAEELMDVFCKILEEAETGKDPESVMFKCRHFIIDADAINLIGKDEWKKELLFHMKKKRIIFTPHLMELSRLTGQSKSFLKEDLCKCMQEFCFDKQAMFVCKDAVTMIIDQNGIYMNQSGSNALATAGSGDCLTGILAALLSQIGHVNEKKDGLLFLENRCDFTENRENCTVTREFENMLISVGCFFHGLLGERLSKKGYGESAIASDLLDEIPAALQETKLYFSC